MDINKKDTVIKCPNCGYEYLPGEIYLPKYFLGQPKEVERTIDGKVDYEFRIPQCLDELYTCDFCKKTFNVTAKLTFETKLDKTKNFDEVYESKLYTNRIYLQE